MYVDSHCATYEISPGPKKSRTKFFKIKAPLLEKGFGYFFCLSTYHGRLRVTFFWAPQGTLAAMVKDIRSFLQHPKGCWKQIFE